MKAHVVVLPGDGIGPEVTQAAAQVLEEAARLFGHEVEFDEQSIGGASIDECGEPLRDEVASRCRRSDAVLLGAVGGARWDDARVRPEQGLLQLRQTLGVFANVRPVRVHPVLVARSVLRPEVVRGTDMVFVRELTGGLYFGRPRGIQGHGHDRVAVDTLRYSEPEIRRVVRTAYALAAGRRARLHSVDKANVLASSQLWRAIVDEERTSHPEIVTDHVLVDTFALRMLTHPTTFDVVVTENMFGDILTDEAAALTGSIGVLPSASLAERGPGVYEPVHGSAPDIEGRGVANPIGAILSAALLARHSLAWSTVAAAIEAAVDATLERGVFTPDLEGRAMTSDVTEHVCAMLRKPPNAIVEVTR